MEEPKVPYSTRTITGEILADIEVLINAEGIDIPEKMTWNYYLGGEGTRRTYPKPTNCNNILWTKVIV